MFQRSSRKSQQTRIFLALRAPLADSILAKIYNGDVEKQQQQRLYHTGSTRGVVDVVAFLP